MRTDTRPASSGHHRMAIDVTGWREVLKSTQGSRCDAARWREEENKAAEEWLLRLTSAHLKPAYDALPSLIIPAALLRDLKTVFQL